MGEVEFFEDFVYEFGADLAFASDSANPVLPVSRPAGDEEGTGAGIPGYAEFTGNRFVWSADAGSPLSRVVVRRRVRAGRVRSAG